MSNILVKPNQLRSASSNIGHSAKEIQRALLSVDWILTQLAVKSIFQGNSAIALLKQYGTVIVRLNLAPLKVTKFTNQLGEIADRFEEHDRKLLEDSAYKTIFVAGESDGKPIHPNDVSQGQVGDCYLIASLASFADQNPEVIRQAIEANPDGTFTVTLYVRDEHGQLIPRKVVVDPRQHPGDHVNFGDNNREAWPLLIEQAYAELYGGYDQIGQGGFPGTALEALTGKDSTTLQASDLSMEQLSKYDQENYAITIASISDGSNNDLYRDGVLVTDHAYYISDVDAANGTVTIRNPWGWPDSTSESGANRNTLEITMTFEEFQRNFSYMSVNPGP